MGLSFVFCLLSFFHFFAKTEFLFSFFSYLFFDMRFYLSFSSLELGGSESIPAKETPLLAQALTTIFFSFLTGCRF